MGGVTVARGSSSLAELVNRIPEVLDNYGSWSGLRSDASVEILSHMRTKTKTTLRGWREIPEEKRTASATQYEGLLEDDNNDWFALIQVNTSKVLLDQDGYGWLPSSSSPRWMWSKSDILLQEPPRLEKLKNSHVLS